MRPVPARLQNGSPLWLLGVEDSSYDMEGESKPLDLPPRPPREDLGALPRRAAFLLRGIVDGSVVRDGFLLLSYDTTRVDDFIVNGGTIRASCRGWC